MLCLSLVILSIVLKLFIVKLTPVIFYEHHQRTKPIDDTFSYKVLSFLFNNVGLYLCFNIFLKINNTNYKEIPLSQVTRKALTHQVHDMKWIQLGNVLERMADWWCKYLNSQDFSYLPRHFNTICIYSNIKVTMFQVVYSQAFFLLDDCQRTPYDLFS